MGKIENYLFYFLVFIVFVFLILSIFNPTSPAISFFLPIISLVVLVITLRFMDKQAQSAERMIEITSRPNISVGVMSFIDLDEALGKNLGIYKLEDIPMAIKLLNTRIVIKNSSNFTAFVWTKLNLKIDGKEEKQYLRIPDYCSAEAIWELDPNLLISPAMLEPSIVDHKDKEISISIQLYFSSIRELPKEPKWIELTTYSFRKKEKQWLKDNLGIPFQIRGLFTI